MGISYLIIAGVLWGLIGPVSKFIFAQGMSPLETAFWRGNIAGLMFLLHWAKFRYSFPKSSKDFCLIVLFGLFGVAGLEASFVYAVHHGGAALASILLYSAPIWVNILSWIFLREVISMRRWIALSIAFIGVVGVCASASSIQLTWTAILWGLGSGFSYALFYLAGKYFFKSYHPVVVFSIAFPIGSIGILPIMMHVSDFSIFDAFTNIAVLPSATWMSCLFLGIISTYIPYLLYAHGLQKIDASRASIITMVEPVVSVTISALIWGELFTLQGYLFAILVLLGAALS